MKIYFTKTAKEYLKTIAKFEGLDFAKEVARQCIRDSNGGYVNFLQVLKSSRKLRPL